jgi:hypothetical protein
MHFCKSSGKKFSQDKIYLPPNGQEIQQQSAMTPTTARLKATVWKQ